MALCPPTNKPHNDIVMTPPVVAQNIVNYIRPSGKILDPSRGAGAFYDALAAHTSDIHWCEISDGVDFLTHNLGNEIKYDWIITNPPWSKLANFMEHSFNMADNVVFLATVTNFVTKKRIKLAEDAGFGLVEFIMIDKPKEWPSSGFQIAAAHYKKDFKSETKWSRI